MLLDKIAEEKQNLEANEKEKNQETTVINQSTLSGYDLTLLEQVQVYKQKYEQTEDQLIKLKIKMREQKY